VDDRVACTVGLLTSELFWVLKRISCILHVVFHVPFPQFLRTRREAGSRQPSRESPYGLEATGYGDWGRPCVVQTIASFER